ncbi:MAG: DNA alkylation repair protein [Anaerolineae bacterium]|nr:DNA alkylation repair protein [Anaerolineae bacterium]
MIDLKEQIAAIVAAYDPANPRPTADALREAWLQFEPKSIAGIKAKERAKQETVGIPVPELKKIGQELARSAGKRVDDFIPLTRLLWDDYGREGRVVTLIPLGKMELAAPEKIIPILYDMCKTCYTWEDADRLAMDALEQIVRKKPDQWLAVLEPWLADENMWVRRAGVTAVGRLPMKHADYAARCLEMTEPLLDHEETEVKKAVSFAYRIIARGDTGVIVDFLDRNVPPDNPVATWVLCDTIRSMATALLPDFVSLIPNFERWAADPDLGSKDRKSVESALAKLRQVKG